MDEREEIKSRIEIVDLIGGYITLKQSGRNFKACCPFHDEKTPSFMVSPERQTWHCFGSCSEGGDIFSFVMKMEGLDFFSALKLLADRAGVTLKRESDKDYTKIRDQKEKYFSANEFAAEFYQKNLHSSDGKKALDYLKKRGLTDKTIAEFQLGFAPRSATVFLSELKKVGFKESEIISAGLAKEREGKIQGYFWDRIMFPITDHAGSVIGFTARTLSDDVQPKYLNTPETEIYRKSKVLYGMDKAKQAIRKSDHAIIVEGNMDVIASHQVGVKNVVAASGTAFTDTQLGIIGRFTKNIKLAFDVDSAGNEATKRAIEMAMREGFNVKIIEVPEGKDPAEAIQKESKIWANACKEATYVIDYLFEKAFIKYGVKDILGKKDIARELLGVIKKIPDEVEREHYTKELGKRLDVSEESLKNALNKIKIDAKKPPKEEKTVEIKQELLLEERLLGLLLYVPEYQNFFLRKVKKEEISKDFEEIYDILVDKKKNSEKADLLEMRAESEFADFEIDKIGEEIFFLTKRLKKRGLDKKREDVEVRLRDAESQKNEEEVKECIKILNNILKEESSI